MCWVTVEDYLVPSPFLLCSFLLLPGRHEVSNLPSMMFLIQLSPGSNEVSRPWNGTAGNLTQNKPLL